MENWEAFIIAIVITSILFYMQWKKDKLKKLTKKILICGLVLFVIVVVFIQARKDAAFNSLPQEERDRRLIEGARDKSDDDKSSEEKMAEFRKRERNKSVYEQNMDFARELDRMNKAAILDEQEKERREINKYRQYK